MHNSAPNMPPTVFRIPNTDVFEMRNVKKCTLWGWGSEHAYLYTKRTTKSVFRCLVWVFLKRTMPKMCIVGVAPQTCIPWHQTYHQKYFWIPGMGVFEMHDDKKCALLGWRSERAYFCTKYATKSSFGYLTRACLKCTMLKNVHFGGGALNMHTFAPNAPPKVFLDAWYGWF